MPDATLQTEIALQETQRQDRVDEFNAFYRRLSERQDGEALMDALRASATTMHLEVSERTDGGLTLGPIMGPVITGRAPRRSKRVRYDPALLPRLDPAKDTPRATS